MNYLANERNPSGLLGVQEDILDLLQSDCSSLGIVIGKMKSPEYFPTLLNQRYENMGFGYTPFEGFSDVGLIYYYVHKPKDLDDSKNRNEDTKKEYLRELLQFYRNLIQYAEVFDFYVKQGEDSLFRSITEKNIEYYQHWLKSAPFGKGGMPYSTATLSRKLTIIKAFLKWLRVNKLIETDLHNVFYSSNVWKKDRPDRSLGEHEVQQILDYHRLHKVNYAILLTLATTGARVREIANAKWSDLYYDGITGHYWLHLITKGDKEREALIFPEVYRSIVEFRRIRRLNTEINAGDDSPLFVTSQGKAYSYKYLSTQVSNIITQTKLEFLKHKERVTPHAFRHFFANYSLSQGVPLADIQRTLGHQKLETTMIYVKKQLERKDNAALKWGQRIY
ncbi:tyrosine-type recombinase/integrase [Pontibacillus halophilus]|uniref:tyrosine-type recombinase/integrase n=1 Tax=Pontibacillus halophilus TaxID=516704 RepID=UPI0003F6914D|nr:site-specific integrase [Pontibacillus halophilus]